MNLENLYSKIHNPQDLNVADIAPLKDLCVKYPFAQIFSILYLKALAQSKDLHFEDELQKQAFKITDRAKLYDLIQSNEIIHNEEVQELETEIKQVEISEEIEQVEINPIEETKLVFEVEVSKEEEVSFPILENDLIQEEEKEEFKIEIPAEEEENKIEEKTSSDLLELEKEFLSHAVASAYSIELEEKSKFEEEIEEKNKIDLSENRSFSSWLKVANSNPISEKKEADKIIEKFIQEEPERIKPKKEFYSAPKKAKESINDDNLIYTETLANIFALQGNYPKAITAFEHLMLTIPEKKLYFAKKIEELNKKINS
ncbi:MAG: hypothetical protein ACK5B9_03805 [Flavobacteriia bacterium]|jgi:hypothetical protein